MSTYWIEIRDGEIVGYTDSTGGKPEYTGHLGGRVVRVTELEYKIISACRGDLEKATEAIAAIQKKMQPLYQAQSAL